MRHAITESTVFQPELYHAGLYKLSLCFGLFPKGPRGFHASGVMGSKDRDVVLVLPCCSHRCRWLCALEAQSSGRNTRKLLSVSQQCFRYCLSLSDA
jgi:hypothetical protein